MPSIGGGATRGCCNPQSFAPQPLTRGQPNRARGFQGFHRGREGAGDRSSAPVQPFSGEPAGGQRDWGRESRPSPTIDAIDAYPDCNGAQFVCMNDIPVGREHAKWHRH